MARIAERTEEDIHYISRFEKRNVKEQKDVTSAISHATCTTAHDLGAVAILTVSKTGLTARMISVQTCLSLLSAEQLTQRY